MHGSIITMPKRYVQTQYDHSTWVKLIELSGLEKVEFDHKTVYPDEHVYALVGHAAELTGIPAGELHKSLADHAQKSARRAPGKRASGARSEPAWSE